MLLRPRAGATSAGCYLPAFFCFFAARFSFRFFWAAFLESFPPPLSLEAMEGVYPARQEYGQRRITACAHGSGPCPP